MSGWQEPQAQQRLVAKQLRWDTGLSTHAWQAVDITTGVPSLYTQWVPPEAYPEVVVSAQALAAASAAACRCYDNDWSAARRSRDPDHLWQVITRAADHMHLTVAGKAVRHGDSTKAANRGQHQQ